MQSVLPIKKGLHCDERRAKLESVARGWALVGRGVRWQPRCGAMGLAGAGAGRVCGGEGAATRRRPRGKEGRGGSAGAPGAASHLRRFHAARGADGKAARIAFTSLPTYFAVRQCHNFWSTSEISFLFYSCTWNDFIYIILILILYYISLFKII